VQPLIEQSCAVVRRDLSCIAMAETSSSDARRLLAEGDALLQEKDFDGARRLLENAQSLFASAGDQDGELEALSKAISVITASGDHAKAVDLAEEKKIGFVAKWNANGEICMDEQIVNACFDGGDISRAEQRARNAIERYREYDSFGMDTTAGQAFMWLFIAQCCSKREHFENAMEAAETATQMFSDMGEYQHESRAVQLYNDASSQKKGSSYLVVPRVSSCQSSGKDTGDDFYAGIRLAAIAYGPKYRSNHIISVAKTGEPHIACVLQLVTENDTEDWEHEVGFNPALIDAGAHAGLAQGLRPTTQEQEEEAAARKMEAQEKAADREDAGWDATASPANNNASIPFLMDHGELRPRSNSEAMYINIASAYEGGAATPQTYMFSH